MLLDLFYLLFINSFAATLIHGDHTQLEHEMVLKTFRQGCTPILVATVIAT